MPFYPNITDWYVANRVPVTRFCQQVPMENDPRHSGTASSRPLPWRGRPIRPGANRALHDRLQPALDLVMRTPRRISNTEAAAACAMSMDPFMHGAAPAKRLCVPGATPYTLQQRAL